MLNAKASSLKTRPRAAALECKNSKRQPIYRKSQVSVEADMRFRGVASLHQVVGTDGHNLEWGNRRNEGRQQGIVGDRVASLPPNSYGVWGAP